MRDRLSREARLLPRGRDRAVPPHETVARWRRDELWRRWGITRVGAVTGLDSIGMPVWMSVRPNARTLAVCQGKGPDDAAAAASALMEAIEIATAEEAGKDSLMATRAELKDRGRRFDDLALYLRRGAALPADGAAQPWLAATDLLSGEPVLLPAEAILLDDTRESRWLRSTDGLASGNLMGEAALHGICERIERDAMALWAHASVAAVRGACLDPETLGDATLCGLTRQIEAAGLRLRLFDITTDIAVPSMFAVIFPGEAPHDGWKYLEVSSGSGCHPRRATAACRAVTEAAQSRLTKIAAARDDFDPMLYDAALPPELLLYAGCTPRLAAVALPAGDEEPCLPRTIRALEAAGVANIWLVVLADEPGLAVAKAVLPELESLPGPRAVAGGPRLVRRMLAAA